ncbi:MAG: DNA primase [Microscillaceae bacterium]|nr:DNA primase [Microscillaceae bacterium]
MPISQETIQLIQDRADVVEVVSDFVTLKKKGTNWMACCPFHNEKTPSFSVSPSKGIYKCFGCGKGGDAISFVMEIENATYPEALRYLAKKYGIEIQEDEKLTDEELAQQTERESILILLDFAKKHFQELLFSHEEGKALGMSYFKERGFLPQTIDTFELGYSLSEWDHFTQHALKQGFRKEILEKAGLSIFKEDHKVFDRFRERVIFPIHNVSGKTIGFGARLLKNDKKQAKYLNSPETPVYQKSKVLYGIAQAKKSIHDLDECFLVEGYTDVISLHQADIRNVVASSGTALTIDQIRLVRRFTQNITVLYDGDSAGVKASLRGIDLILEEDLNVRIVALPDQEDPDSYLRKIGPSAFQKYLSEHREDFITFKAKLYAEEAKQDPIKRAEMIREVVGSIMKIPDEIKRRVYFQTCANLLEIDENTLIREGNQLIKNKAYRQDHPAILQKTDTLIQTPETETQEASETIEEKLAYPTQSIEKECIRLLLNYKDSELKSGQKLGKYLLQEISDIQFEHHILKEMLEIFRKQTSVQSDFFVKHENAAIKSLAIDLITQDYQISTQWEAKHMVYTPEEKDILDKIVQENIFRLKLYQVQKLIKQNEEKLHQAQSDSEQDKYLMIALKLKKLSQEIAGQLNNVVLKG